MTDHYRIFQDRRIPNAVSLPGLHTIIPVYKQRDHDYSSLKRSVIIKVLPSKFNYYPDILDQQLFLVKDWLKKVILSYQPTTKFHTFYVMDNVNRKLYPYYLPELPALDCFSQKSEANVNISRITTLFIRREQKGINDYGIFRVDNVLCHTVLVSTALAESILRRNPDGLRVEKVYYEEESPAVICQDPNERNSR